VQLVSFSTCTIVSFSVTSGDGKLLLISSVLCCIISSLLYKFNFKKLFKIHAVLQIELYRYPAIHGILAHTRSGKYGNQNEKRRRSRSPPFFEKDTEHRINISLLALGRLIHGNDFRVRSHAETLSTVTTFFEQIVIR
jgi:hypothetical protein